MSTLQFHYYAIGNIGQVGLLFIAMGLVNMYGDYGVLMVFPMIIWGIFVSIKYANVNESGK